MLPKSRSQRPPADVLLKAIIHRALEEDTSAVISRYHPLSNLRYRNLQRSTDSAENGGDVWAGLDI